METSAAASQKGMKYTMKKRILGYLEYVDTLLDNPPADADWDHLLTEHVQQIQFFQHERLIHLIVTVLFALMTTACLIGMVLSFHLSLVILLVPLLILLFPYINHYYLLENSVQKMYVQYDRMQMLKDPQCLSAFSASKHGTM